MTDRLSLQADLLHHQQSGDLAAQAETLMALAAVALDEDDYSIAQGLYGQAWEAYNTLGDQRQIANAVQHLATAMNALWWSSMDEQEALDFDRPTIIRLYEYALALYATLGDQWAQAKLYRLMVKLQLYQGSVAQQALQNALTLYESLGDISAQIETASLLAHLYGFDMPEHRFYLEHVLTLYQQQSDRRGVAKTHLELYRLDESLKNYPAARDTLNTAVNLLLEIEDYSEIMSLVLRLCSLIMRTDGRDAFEAYYEDMRQRLRPLPIKKPPTWDATWDT